MPQNKSILFSSQQQKQATIAHALCHPARLNIIKHLNNHFLLCSELTALIPLTQSTISHHLNCLLQVNIIKRSEEFGAVGYNINNEGWLIAKQLLQQFFKETA